MPHDTPTTCRDDKTRTPNGMLHLGSALLVVGNSVSTTTVSPATEGLSVIYAAVYPTTTEKSGLSNSPEDLRRLYGLEVTEEIVWLPLLETVSIDAPGWIPSDNFFHLLAATPYSVRLQRCCDQAAPLGKVASVDSLGSATITARA